MKLENDMNCVSQYIEVNGNNDYSIDLTGMNIFDSLKAAVLSSAYFYQKYPEKKLRCKFDDTELLMSAFNIQNLEFV